MNDAISVMLQKYKCKSVEEYEHALKEIIQEVALLGLWRAKFFEKAAFYGGTALRIFHGLDRFSEDLDFSLLRRISGFDLSHYCTAIRSELDSFGFNVVVSKKEKSAGTIQNLIMVETPAQLLKRIQGNRVIKVKLEVDVDPPGGFQTESKYLLQPIPFSVVTFQLPDLFAGKMHAVLCREWKTRVKGRDWYDFVWYVGRGVPLNLQHLQKRMAQTEHIARDEKLSKARLLELLGARIEEVDFEAAKRDVEPMLKDPSSIKVWSKDFFLQVAGRINVSS